MQKASFQLLSQGTRRMAIPSPSVLLVRLDAIGDALAMTPLIAALRERGIPVSAVLRPANAHAFAERALDEVFIDSPNLARDLRGRFTHALVATEDARGYRLAYDAHIPMRTGFENGWGKPFKTLWVRRLCTSTVYRTAGLDPRAPHECSVIFGLGRALLGPEALPTRDVAVLRPLVIDNESPPDPRAIVQVTDKWERLGASLDDVVEAARRIASRHGARFVASSLEREYARRFGERIGADVETFDTLAPWKEAIASARALLAPDSGALHVAGMTGTPVVAVYPRVPMFASQTSRWAPWAAPHSIVAMEGAWPVVAADALEELLSGSRAVYTG